jgi:hypothetical protein
MSTVVRSVLVPFLPDAAKQNPRSTKSGQCSTQNGHWALIGTRYDLRGGTWHVAQPQKQMQVLSTPFRHSCEWIAIRQPAAVPSPLRTTIKESLRRSEHALRSGTRCNLDASKVNSPTSHQHARLCLSLSHQRMKSLSFRLFPHHIRCSFFPFPFHNFLPLTSSSLASWKIPSLGFLS